LSYTIPDNSTWETDGEIGYLPKFIDVAITIKFIESDGAQYKPYGYKLSKEGVRSLNQDREAANFDTNSRVSSNGVLQKETPIPAMNSRGIVTIETKPQVASIKNLTTGDKEKSIPEKSDLGLPSEKSSQPFAIEKLKT
jgi:hypothetical protein